MPLYCKWHLQVALLADQARRLQGQLHDFLPSQVPLRQQQPLGLAPAGAPQSSMQPPVQPNSTAK